MSSTTVAAIVVVWVALLTVDVYLVRLRRRARRRRRQLAELAELPVSPPAAIAAEVRRLLDEVVAPALADLPHDAEAEEQVAIYLERVRVYGKVAGFDVDVDELDAGD